ncbi:MAG: septal ring lytic transglycosylase RlpA family protein, partial [Deltaproteobacteria bacterium]
EKDRIPPTQRPYRVDGHIYYPLPSAYGYREFGVASWYGRDFHGRKTSNGETYNMYAETAAHKTLPMGTHVLVRNLDNGRETIVRINDRGPFVRGRIIDLSLTAARKLGIDQCGTARVEVVALGEAATYRSDGRTYKRFLPYADPNRGEFFVQVGSFTNRENAYRLKGRLLAMDRKTVIQSFKANGSTYYRVQVRAGQTLNGARKVERRMEEMGFPEAFVVAR